MNRGVFGGFRLLAGSLLLLAALLSGCSAVTVQVTETAVEGEMKLDFEAVESAVRESVDDVVRTFAADGDLNGDGIDDAAVVFAVSGGGSGTFYSLAAVINQGGAAVHVSSALLLGDRIQLEALSIEEGVITVQMVAHGPQDPMCCPTQRVVRRYQLIEDDMRLLSEETVALPAGEDSAALTAEILRNATYQHGFPKAGQAQLQDGMYEEKIDSDSASVIYLALSDQIAIGDLDGDGVDDAAVVLAANGGGSGTYYSLAAVINQDGTPLHVASASLGDRILLEALDIAAGVITVRMVAHGPDDGLCCPTQRVVHRYQLLGNALQLLSLEELGAADDSE